MRALPILLLLFTFNTPAEEATGRSAIDERLALEWDTRDNPFSITPHRPTYILPITYSTRINTSLYVESEKYQNPKHTEIKFQFSFKVPLARGFPGDGRLSFAYTQQSFWQAYSHDYSAPFRETNHEPELLLTFPLEYRLFGLQGKLLTFSLNHQSNGRSEPLSRSWNRFMVDMVMERGDWYFSLKPWWRFPEQGDDDDNPHIEHYMGNFELRALHQFGDHSTGLMWRNNLKSSNRGAIQFDYTFPLNKRLRGYLQLFSGYGASLNEHDHFNNRIGIGVMLTDWL